ncbi:hypothetical protein [Pseudarthrobacter phenanthrenivorans]|nr:hypothetical protein [Pseudarthrobacter phenanthrenivorans]
MALYHASLRMPMDSFWGTPDPWGNPEGAEGEMNLPGQRPTRGQGPYLLALGEIIRSLVERRDGECYTVEEADEAGDSEAGREAYDRLVQLDEEVMTACSNVLGALGLSKGASSTAIAALKPALTALAR